MPSPSEAERGALLELARNSIVEAVSRGELPGKIPSGGIFGERRGVFVTAHVRGELRGCIGVVEGDEPLAEAIVRCAVSAVRNDTRFAPVRPHELADLEIEISLLSPLQPILVENIELGRHGLVIAQEKRRGLLLPQVAPEHGLTKDQFLEETCRKAGLPRNAWQAPETKIYGFTCDVFSDRKRVANL
jgi:AmmeMemoRadiSam system protein A